MERTNSGTITRLIFILFFFFFFVPFLRRIFVLRKKPSLLPRSKNKYGVEPPGRKLCKKREVRRGEVRWGEVRGQDENTSRGCDASRFLATGAEIKELLSLALGHAE